MRKTLFLTAALLAAAPLLAQDKAPEAPSPPEIVAAAPKADWIAIAASELMVMDLAPDAKGKPRRVVIQLMPAPFSQGWVGNIRKLAAARFWDGTSINRVQDNYVVQWGDAEGENPKKAKALPAGLLAVPEGNYEVDAEALSEAHRQIKETRAPTTLQLEFEAAVLRAVKPGMSEKEARDAFDAVAKSFGMNNQNQPTAFEEIQEISIKSTRTAKASQGWHERDSVAEWVEFWQGWPLGNLQKVRWTNKAGKQIPPPSDTHPHVLREQGITADVEKSHFWPVHCYGMVGVGRDMPPNTGSGAELYTVIGHAPRHLDRNIALVGRVIEGIEHLSSLKRGHGDLGFYDLAKGDERTGILSVRIGSEVKDLPSYEYLQTDSASFAKYADARANRRDAFFIRPAGGADICNIPVPVRRAKG